MRHLRPVLLALVVLLSTVSAPLAGVAAASGPPSGFVGVPAENVGPPDHANAPDSAGPPPGAGPPSFAGPPADVPTEAAAWDVLATDHAGTLSVEVGATADGRLALRLGDVENHAGREVAVDAGTLEDALGYRPETVSGLHSSGERWTATVRYDGSHAVFSVPRFSTNTVTFDAEKSIAASPAEDGDTFTYDVADSDAVENLSVTLTGRENVQDAGTQAIASDGESVAISVGGTTAPRNATVEFTGRRALLDGTQVESYTEHTGTGQDVAVVDGVVYSADPNGVVAYDTATDSVAWTAAPTSGDVTALDADGDRVVVGGSNGEVYVLDAATGAVENSHSEHTATITVVAVDDAANMAYSGSGGTETVVHPWDLTDDGRGGYNFDYTPTAIAADGGDFAVGLSDGTVESNGLGGGYWETADFHTSTRDLTYRDGVLYGVGRDAVKVANVSDGSVLWSHSEHTADGLAIAVSSDGGTVYSSGEDGRVLAYDVGAGSVAWEHSAHTTEAASIAYDAPNGTLYSLGVDDSTVLGYQDRRETEDPAVDLDGDGTPEASVSGVLEDGQTHTETVPLSTSTSSLDVSTTASTEVGLNVTWEEVTETENPEVTVNGHTVGYDGVLEAGNSTALDVSDAWVENGTNTVSVGVSQVADGPPGLVGLDYSHRALEERAVAYGATAWSESYDVSRTYVSDVEDARLRVPWASERVVSVRSVTVTVNGSEVAPESYASENGTLEVAVGAVSEGATVNVSAVGSKVQARNGAIRVVNATEEGLSLDSRVEVVEVTDPANFSLEVGGTDEGHLLHDSSAETWSETSSYLTVSPDGGQTLHLEGAVEGGRFSVSTTPVELRPTGAPVEAIVLDESEPRFRVREAAGHAEADDLEVLYYDTESGQEYELYSETEERGVATDVAESPVEFLVDGGDDTYTIRLYDSPSATGDGAAVAVGAGGGSSSGLAPAAVVLGAGLAVLATVLLGRRFGVDGTRGTVLLGVVALVVAAIGAEAVTRGSVLALVLEAFLDPLVDSQLGVVAGAIGLLLGVWAVNDWVGLPWWVVGLAVAGDAIWLLDTVTGGALGGGLGEVSALLWLVGIFGGMYLLYTRLKPRDIVIQG